MADWILIPCLKMLFAEFDLIAPGRDHASDGAKGDAAHEKEVSDHNQDEVGKVPIHDADHINEVHAIDVDADLGNDVSWSVGNTTFYGMEAVVQFLLSRCRSGAERRLRYIIFRRRIWSASSGWVEKPYTGASAHTEHAHFSASYTTALEASTASWHLEDIPVALTTADKAWIADLTEKAAALAAKEVWYGTRFEGTETGGQTYQRSPYDCLADLWCAVMTGTTRGGDPVPPHGQITLALAAVGELTDLVDELVARQPEK